MRRLTWFVVAAVLGGLLAGGNPAPAAVGREPAETGGRVCEPVALEFFFEPGCSQCAKVREEVLPELDLRYAGFYELVERDIGVPDNYLRLARYQEALGSRSNEPVSMVVDGGHLLPGFEGIRDGLFPLLDRLIAERLAAPSPPGPGTPAPGGEGGGEGDLLQSRQRSFTFFGVVVAGLLDGINPCAISTLIFFVSLLSVLRVSRRQIILVGTLFVLASFLTYLAIGFGLFRAIQLLAGFEAAKRAINWLMIGVLGVFAFLSFRDAVRYRRSGKSSDVSLQLPDSLKLKIHKVMKSGLGMGSLAVGSLVVGSTVTLLESVCTGQVYVPTIVMLIKSGMGDFRSYAFLFFYNLLFQVPIVTVFILILQGMKTHSLIHWSQRNVVFSKTLMGLFFVGMAVLILVM